MKHKLHFSLRFMAVFVCTVSFAIIGNAQASRTWVSGVGDDVNPCSRTAPCKTFAGAISKTAANGEINTLDPGGYGTVTITKSITIDGEGTMASILAAGASAGVIINAASTDTIILRNLSINGGGTGLNGIRIISAKAVYIENLKIFNFSNRGITDDRSTGGSLFVLNTTVEKNAQSNIFISPTLGGPGIIGDLRNVNLLGSTGNSGLAVRGGSKVSISNSLISGNFNFGIVAEEDAGNTDVTVESCVVTNNGTGIGVLNNAPNIRISNVTVTGNTVGLSISSGTIFSFGNNKIDGNGSSSPVSGVIPQQ